MAAMAADAEQRYQKRQKNLKIATELKEKGNIALKENRFEDADSLYSEGLDLVKDFKMAVVGAKGTGAFGGPAGISSTN